MFIRHGTSVAISAVAVLEGKFWRPAPQVDSSVDAELTFQYLDRENGRILGTCKVPLAALGQKSRGSLQDFLKNVEEDFGSLVFRSGAILPQSSPLSNSAETNRGLGAVQEG